MGMAASLAESRARMGPRGVEGHRERDFLKLRRAEKLRKAEESRGKAPSQPCLSPLSSAPPLIEFFCGGGHKWRAHGRVPRHGAFKNEKQPEMN